MVFFDAHCDTALKLFKDKSDLMSSDNHIDINKLKKSGKFVQTFAIFVDPAEYKSVEMRNASDLFDALVSQFDSYSGHIALCRNYDEILGALNSGRIAALISIENGGAFQGELSALRNFYRLGVRSVCLTWNYRNEIADGIKETSTGGGLTEFGRQVVCEMNRLGMLIDVSHISEKGFRDVVELSEDPVIASHSNAKRICNHIRNLNDEQILAIKENGGVIGINFCPEFLNETGKASSEDIIKHIEYISALAGPEHVGFGADFDGIEATPDDIRNAGEILRVIDKLLALNYRESDVEAIAGGNFLRVVKEVLK